MKTLDSSKRLEGQLFVIGLFLPPAGFVLWYVSEMLKPLIPLPLQGCLWDKWFHVYCPGCGGTRALAALLKGKIILSVWYHPAVIYGAALYVIYMGSHALAFLSGGRIRGLAFRSWYLYAAIALLGLNCILKNLLRYTFGILMI